MRPNPGRRRVTSHVFARNSQMQNPHVAARGVVPGWRLSKKVINAYGGLPFVMTESMPAEECRRLAVTRQVKEEKINRGRNIPICSSELRGPNDPQTPRGVWCAMCGVRCAMCVLPATFHRGRGETGGTASSNPRAKNERRGCGSAVTSPTPLRTPPLGRCRQTRGLVGLAMLLRGQLLHSACGT